MRAALVILATLLGAIGCSRAPLVTIRNQSSLILSNIVVSGSGFEQTIPSIPAGGECRIRVQPQGGTCLRLVFDAGTNHVDSGEKGYVDAAGGYRVTATVRTNLIVAIEELKVGR